LTNGQADERLGRILMHRRAWSDTSRHAADRTTVVSALPKSGMLMPVVVIFGQVAAADDVAFDHWAWEPGW
jgi:hypothetical protein